MIDFCLAEEETDAGAFAGWRAGVRAALVLSPAMMHELQANAFAAMRVQMANTAESWSKMQDMIY